MLRCQASTLLLALALTGAHAQVGKPKFIWSVKVDKASDTPQGQLYVQIGKKKVKVDEFAGNPNVIEPSQYKEVKIHASASHAINLWWAGQGAKYFVVTVGPKTFVKKQEMAEEFTEVQPWKTISVYDKAGRKLRS